MASRKFVNDIFNLNPAVGGQGEWIKVYTGKETIEDKYDGNTTVVYNNPLPIVAIVTDLTAAQAKWKMPGIEVAKVKEIFVKSKYRPLIEMSQQIEIEGDMYEGWRENGRLQIRQLAGDVLRLYVYIKVV
jgi:hypothetical protein